MAYTYCNVCNVEIEYNEEDLAEGTVLSHVTCYNCMDENMKDMIFGDPFEVFVPYDCRCNPLNAGEREVLLA